MEKHQSNADGHQLLKLYLSVISWSVQIEKFFRMS